MNVSVNALQQRSNDDVTAASDVVDVTSTDFLLGGVDMIISNKHVCNNVMVGLPILYKAY